MTYDIYNPDTKVILFRNVVNDAVVGPWLELNDVIEHTKAGLRDWMRQENEKIKAIYWEPENLRRRSFWEVDHSSPSTKDKGLWDYGTKLQFWIPTGERKMEFVKSVCVDVLGITGLTEGKEYQAAIDDDLLYVVVDDNGQERSFFRSRFRRV